MEIDELMGGPARIDRLTMTYHRRGKCDICLNVVEREKSFVGKTLEDCQQQAEDWAKTPLRHKRCE